MSRQEILQICVAHGIVNISRDSYRIEYRKHKDLPSVNELVQEFGNFSNFKNFLLQEMNMFDNIKMKWRNDVVAKRKELFIKY